MVQEKVNYAADYRRLLARFLKGSFHSGDESGYALADGNSDTGLHG